MTDQTIPADKIREIIDAHRDGASRRAGVILAAMEALLPPPPRPTLADMNEEERDACTGMQADAETGERVIIIDGTERSDGRVQVLSGEIYVYLPFATEVTPRPDLPRLEWPADHEAGTPDGVPPNTLNVGSEWDDVDALTLACKRSGRAQIVVIDRGGDVSVWGNSIEWWETEMPCPGYEPFTIIHTGRKADQ